MQTIDEGKLTFKSGYWKGRNMKYMTLRYLKAAHDWLERQYSVDFCNKEIKLMELRLEIRLKEGK